MFGHYAEHVLHGMAVGRDFSDGGKVNQKGRRNETQPGSDRNGLPDRNAGIGFDRYRDGVRILSAGNLYRGAERHLHQVRVGNVFSVAATGGWAST